jgi:hypothetical protein
MYYQISPKPLHEGVSCAYLEEKYHKLLSWADAFSTDLICAEDSHHHLLVVQ